MASPKQSKSAARSSALQRKSEIEFINGLDNRRRFRSLNVEKSLPSSSSSESSCGSGSEANVGGGGGAAAESDVDDESELKDLLAQTKTRLEDTNALRVRSHLLRPEDYVSNPNQNCPFIDKIETTTMTMTTARVEDLQFSESFPCAYDKLFYVLIFLLIFLFFYV